MTWKKEFGYNWKVPHAVDALVEAGKLTDESWHNDAMPRFWTGPEGEWPKYELWVAHWDPRVRADKLRGDYIGNTDRYLVSFMPDDDLNNAESRYSGDDLGEALKAMGLELPAWPMGLWGGFDLKEGLDQIAEIMQVAEELGGPDAREYVIFMKRVHDECAKLAQDAADRIVALAARHVGDE
jgi:hypothetical protein